MPSKFRRALEEADTKADRDRVIQERQPNDPHPARFLDLARKYPRSDAALDAQVWIVRNADASRVSSARVYRSAVDLMLDHHVKSQRMADCVIAMGRIWGREAAPAIARSLERLTSVEFIRDMTDERRLSRRPGLYP